MPAKRKDGATKATAATATASTGPKFGATELVQRAVQLMDELEFAAAERFCERAVATEPTHVEALETLAAVKLELDKPDEAQELLAKAVELAPDRGHAKYLSLAQLHEGHEALKLLEKGVELLIAATSANTEDDGEERAQLARQLSSAYCAMTELYLTDCCYDEDAEQRCEQYTSQALTWDPKNPEAYQSLASVCISQQKLEAAAEIMQKGLELWLPAEPPLDEEVMDTSDMPPFEFRMSTVKLLIELGQYDRALDVVETLMVDNDGVVEVWYLCGYAHYLAKEMEQAEDSFAHGIELHRQTNCDDDELLESMQHLLAEVSAGSAGNDEDKAKPRKHKRRADDNDMDMDM